MLSDIKKKKGITNELHIFLKKQYWLWKLLSSFCIRDELFWDEQSHFLTHFSPMTHFYTPWNKAEV